MRTVDHVQKDIEHCQGQIAAIYDLPEKQQDAITLEGFQRKLKELLNEKHLLNITVHARVITPNGSEHTFIGWDVRERTQQTHNRTIQQLNNSRS